jgi:FAD synthase
MQTNVFKLSDNKKEQYICCIGAYEPWQVSHGSLMSSVKNVAVDNDLGFAVILLYPHPAAALKPHSEQIKHLTPLDKKVEILRGAGADVIVVAHFTQADVEMNAYDFLNEIRKHLPIHSLFMGPRQSLGTGPLGGSEALRDYARKSGLGLYFLKNNQNQKLENPNYVHSNS